MKCFSSEYIFIAGLVAAIKASNLSDAFSESQTTSLIPLAQEFNQPLSETLLDLLPQTLTQNETDFQPKALEEKLSQEQSSTVSPTPTATTTVAVNVTTPRNVTTDPCAGECPDVVEPVCGLDFQLGYKIFINKCLLELQNRCRNSRKCLVSQ